MAKGFKLQISQDACLSKAARGNSYPDKETAQRAVRSMLCLDRGRVVREMGDRYEMRAFTCRWCFRWHVGRYKKKN